MSTLWATGRPGEARPVNQPSAALEDIRKAYPYETVEDEKHDNIECLRTRS